MVETRMTGEMGRVLPPQDFRLGRLWHEQCIRRRSSESRGRSSMPPAPSPPPARLQLSQRMTGKGSKRSQVWHDPGRTGGAC